PLSRGQLAMWFLQQLDPAGTAYHLGDAVRIDGPLDVAALGRAWNALVQRHGGLRATIVGESGELRQHGQAQGLASTFEVRDRSTREAAEIVEEARRELEQRFDLEHGPLARLLVMRRTAGEHYLLLAMHHIVGELWALIVIVQELSRLYA